MKSKYQLPIIVIAVFLAMSLVVSTSYGLYKLVNEDKSYVVIDDECLEMIADDYYIDKDLTVLNDTDGKTSEAYSIAFSNICSEEKNIEIRLNILEGSNLKKGELMVYTNGDLKGEPTLFGSFINSASNKSNDNLYSKVIGELSIPANSTKRINIRTWIDDTRVTDYNQTIKAVVEVTSNKTVVKPIFKETLLSNNTISSESIDFSVPEKERALFLKTLDDSGTSYYFRGNVTNNYVSFAGLRWRIIRINGDGSVRLIYDGDEELLSTYNTAYNDTQFLELEYTNDGAKTSSAVKEYLDTWYQEHLKDYDNYITDSSFCNDMSFITSYGPNYYGAYNRLTDGNPSLICPKDSYVYNMKIGLITADEVAMAGGVRGQGNDSYYLYTGYGYYTISPSRFVNGVGYMNMVNIYGTINEISVNNEIHIRPVISLESIVSVTGKGTIDNPYIIDPIEE